MRNEVLKQAKRIVVKIGSSLVSSGKPVLYRSASIVWRRSWPRFGQPAGKSCRVVRRCLRHQEAFPSKSIPSLPVKQAAAAVGQSRLMWAYEKSFERLGIKVAQILLTHQDLTDRRRFLNARHTLTALIEFQVIPYYQ